jgi:pyrroloquinoline quinone biosynthesis protein B
VPLARTRVTLLSAAIAVIFLLMPGSPSADENAPYLYVLGIAQDAGYPQAGCYQDHCLSAWKNPAKRRAVVALGLIDLATGHRALFEATPNLPDQLRALEEEAPADSFRLDGVFLTHAHIGHYTGLIHFGHEVMGASGVPVYAMPRMREFLETNGPWSQLVSFGNINLHPLEEGSPQQLGMVQITPFRVPHRDEYSETVGYRIAGPNKTAVFIPDIDKWSEWEQKLPELIAGVDYALVDATFYADGELPGRDMSKVRHPFVVETMALLEHLPKSERQKVWFIHMNHTNPLLHPESEESRSVRSQGFHIAEQGVRLGL